MVTNYKKKFSVLQEVKGVWVKVFYVQKIRYLKHEDVEISLALSQLHNTLHGYTMAMEFSRRA